MHSSFIGTSDNSKIINRENNIREESKGKDFAQRKYSQKKSNQLPFQERTYSPQPKKCSNPDIFDLEKELNNLSVLSEEPKKPVRTTPRSIPPASDLRPDSGKRQETRKRDKVLPAERNPRKKSTKTQPLPPPVQYSPLNENEVAENVNKLFQSRAKAEELQGSLKLKDLQICDRKAISQSLLELEDEIFAIERMLVAHGLLTSDPKCKVTPTNEGSNGSYYLFYEDRKIGVYKPRLKAAGALDSSTKNPSRKGIKPGTECLRERLADVANKVLSLSLPDYIPQIRDFGVPPTDIDAFTHDDFGSHHDVGSMQKFEKDCTSIQDLTTVEIEDSISLDQFLKAVVFDSILLNLDRHNGNLLLNKAKDLILIDHGACFPSVAGFGKDAKNTPEFEWIFFPQAKQILPPHWKEYIAQIDDKKLLQAFVAETESYNKKFPNSGMNLGVENLYMIAHSILLLKAWVIHGSSLSIKEFANGYLELGIPMALAKHSTTNEKTVYEIHEDPSKFKADKFCLDHELDQDQFYFEAKRVVVGGHFAKLMKENWTKVQATLKQSLRSPITFIDQYEAIKEKINSSITPNLFKTTLQRLQEIVL